MAVSPTVFEKMANVWVSQQIATLQAQAGAPGDLLNLALRTLSTGSYETYAWLAALPAVKQWLGEKKAKELKDFGMTIKNLPFYDAVAVDRNDLRDDRVGAYETMIRTLPEKMMQHWRNMISDLIKNGTSGLAFDGVAYFSNASGARVIDNLLAGSGVDTVAHVMTDIDSVVQAMMAFVDDEGEVLNIIPDTLVVPPAAKRVFDSVVFSTADPSSSNAGTRNPFADYGFRVIANAKLSDANDWYAFCTKGQLKPFVFQEREALRSVLDDTRVKETRMYKYSVEWDGNSGYGLPHLGVKVVNS